MALFGFGDIKFDKGTSSTRGPLSSLATSEYKTNFLRYPADIGNADKGHYMVIYIRKQAKSQAGDTAEKNNAVQSAVENVVSDAQKNITGGVASFQQEIQKNFGGELANKINNGLNDIGKTAGSVINDVSSAVNKTFGTSIPSVGNIFGQSNKILSGNSAATQQKLDRNIKTLTSSGNITGSIRKTVMTKDAIALYMPDTLLFTHSQNYENLSVGSSISGQLAAGIAGIAKGENIGDSLKGAAAAIFSEKVAKGKFGGTGALGAFAATGAVVNPIMEVIYQSPNFRTFQYDFLFYPRDEAEAIQVQKIINTLKYHQAPEFLEGFGVGLLVPPSEFEIKFYYSGKENENIPSVSTCVLTNIDTDYAPNGWSAYEVPGQLTPEVGGTGMPVAIRMSLQFQEITYLTKNLASEDPFSPEKIKEYEKASQSGQYGTN